MSIILVTSTEITMGHLFYILLAILILFAPDFGDAELSDDRQNEISVTSYGSIQEAINANPGKMIYLPSGDYQISRKIQFSRDGSGLFGTGRIIQTDPKEPILEIERASGIRIRDVILTRHPTVVDTLEAGVKVINCENVTLDNLQIINNRTRTAAIFIHGCTRAQVRNCLVRNYMRITVDDRTQGGKDNSDWGYAFNCIDGTGFAIKASVATLVQGNRIIEKHLLPTPEAKEKFNLGQFVKRNKKRGSLISVEAWNAGYVNNWHQGSALLVSGSPTDYTQVLGNYIESAAQGIDIHSDHVIVSDNIVNNAFIGMKAMHGSRNVIITNNHFSRNDLWAIGLMPGTASQAAKPDAEANVDGGSIIANNIISDFGYGHASWMWWRPDEGFDGCYPIRLDKGQKPDDPPLKDVIITGNIIYDTGGDGLLIDGRPQQLPPRYRYAVYVSTDALGPQGVHFSNNIFHPGRDGISNVELKP